MSLNRFKENECLLANERHCPCIEFIVSEPEFGKLQRHGFHLNQLLHYRMDENESEGREAPPERLTIAFATADVTITGWRLGRLVDWLRDGTLLAVCTLPARYANVDPLKCIVTSITIIPINKGE